MKFFQKLLTAAVLCLPIAVSAQFVQPPTVKSAFAGYSIPGSGTNVLTIAASGAATTNLLTASTNGVPAQYAQICTVGANGFGVHVLASGSGAATNTLAFEYTGDGNTWVFTPPIMIFTTNYANGTTTFTNLLPTAGNNIGNLAAIRLKYITNSSGNALNITNIFISTR